MGYFEEFCQSSNTPYIEKEDYTFAYRGGDYYFMMDYRDDELKIYQKVDNKYKRIDCDYIESVFVLDDLVVLNFDSDTSASFRAIEGFPLVFYDKCLYAKGAMYFWSSDSELGLVVLDDDYAIVDFNYFEGYIKDRMNKLLDGGSLSDIEEFLDFIKELYE